MGHKAEGAVVLGTFDGVHIAHRKLLKEAAARGPRSGLTALTFDRLPGSVFHKEEKAQQIIECEDKVSLLRSAGADRVEVLAFERQLYTMSAEAFFREIIIGRYGAKHLSVGHDYRFGWKGQGDVNLLASLCERTGVELFVLCEMSADGVRVSSSEIRRRIASGMPEAASELLGRVHFFRARRSGGRFQVAPGIVLPPAGSSFLTAAFGDMPCFQAYDGYDSSIAVREEGGDLYLEGRGESLERAGDSAYFLFGPMFAVN